MDKSDAIFVAGHRGLVGAALVRRLHWDGYSNLLTRTHAELDLTDRGAVDAFFAAHRPRYVLLAAGRVGGIHANNTYPAEFIRENLLIQTHLIDAACRGGVEKLLFLGSSCIYPKHAAQPIREEALLSGPLEPTNAPYAIAKIAGLEMCAAYRRQYGFRSLRLMPTNLYGPGDNFDLDSSHVLPALIRKFCDAQRTAAAQVVLWGSGAPRREFLHVDDLADACVYLMQNHDDDAPLNIGVGKDISIRELAALLAELTGFAGQIVYDTSRPDGTPRKVLDVSRLNATGWRPRIALRDGLRSTIQWYRNQHG